MYHKVIQQVAPLYSAHVVNSLDSRHLYKHNIQQVYKVHCMQDKVIQQVAPLHSAEVFNFTTHETPL